MAAKNKRQGRAQKGLIFFPVLVVLCGLLSLFGDKRPAPQPVSDPGAYSVSFLDVGQGDATLLSLGGEHILIDASTTEAGDTVLQALEQRGVTHLRAVIASHPHEDHIGGFPTVLNAISTDTIYMPDATSTSKSFERLLDTIEKKKISAVVPQPGDQLEIGGTSVTFLWPDPAAPYDGLNNTSLIVLADTGETRVLFVGDAEKAELKALVDSGADISCDIYKVGHHGSSNSSQDFFLQAAMPRVAVISCAKSNTYGHPHESALRRLEAVGAQIYITAEDGTVTLPLASPSSPSQKENTT